MSIPTYGKLDEATDVLGWGLQIKKYAFGTDSVDNRDLWLRKADGSIHWGPTGKRGVDGGRTIKVSEISELYYGKENKKVFEKKSAAQAVDKRCVSILTAKRSLDCEFDTEEHAIMAVAVIASLCKKASVKFTYKSKIVVPTPASAGSAAGSGGADSKSAAAAVKIDRVDTAAANSGDGAADSKSAPNSGAASPVGAAIPATAAAVAVSPTPATVASVAGKSDPDDPLREKFFAEVTSAGKASGIEFFVIVKPAADSKCYHSTSKPIGPREFAHLDAAVRTSTQLLNLTETPPLASDVTTKQRLAACKDEIEAVKGELAETMEAIQKLEAADSAAAPAAAAAPDNKDGKQ